MNMFIEFLGFSVLIMGIWDAYKYKLISKKNNNITTITKAMKWAILNTNAFLFNFFIWFKFLLTSL